MSNTPVPHKWNSSTTYMKLQYQLGGTENGTGSMHQAYCDTELPVTPKPTVETTINLEGEAGEAQPAEIR